MELKDAPPSLVSRKAATAVAAIRELHVALDCPNEAAFLSTLRTSSIISFPYPVSLTRYFYRVHLRQYPCVHCIRSKVSKPNTRCIKPSVKRQLATDTCFIDTDRGKQPKLVCTGTIEELGSTHDLPMKYTSEDIRSALIERLKQDTYLEVCPDEITADPESSTGKAAKLFSGSSLAHLTSTTVPTATHVALAESYVKKVKSKLRSVQSQLEAANSVPMPLYFASTTFDSVSRKTSFTSSQGTYSATAPAVLRGEEPLDYKALISIKAGDVVLAYKREEDRSAVFVVVLDHEFSSGKPAVTAGFSLETKKSTSAGKGKYAKWTKVTSYPDYSRKTLQSLSKQGAAESAKNKRRQEKSRKKLEGQLKAPSLAESTRLDLVRQLKDSPPLESELELEEVITPPAVQTQGGEVSVASNLSSLETKSVDPPAITDPPAQPEPVQDQAPIQQDPSPEQTATSPTPEPEPSEPLRRSSRRSKKEVNYRSTTKDYKSMHVDYEVGRVVHGHIRLQPKSTRSRGSRRKRKLEDLKKVRSVVQTSISEAVKESPDDKDKVHQAVKDEWDQVTSAPSGEKKVLKLVRKTPSVKGKMVVPCLVFMRKKVNQATGKLIKWKARLVGGGHRQDPSAYPKSDISVPTLDHASLLLLLALLMKRKDCKFYQMDFPGAYLKASLESEVYMKIDKQSVSILKESHPETIESTRDDGTIVARIQKALYGLKESGGLFRDKVVEVFKEFGLYQLESHPCILQKKLEDGKYFFACVYVDDVTIGTSVEGVAERLAPHCDQVPPGLELVRGDKFSFLGVSIHFDYTSRTIRYDTSVYIEELRAKFDTTSEESVPCGSDLVRDDPSAKQLSSPTEYKSLVMALFYIAKKIRADTLFPVAYLATECASPTTDHMLKALRTLAYLKGTADLKLVHNCSSDSVSKLFALIDASYATHKDMKGHTGAFFTDMSSSPLFWSSSKQKVVGKSSTDTEVTGTHCHMNSVETLKSLHDETTGGKGPVILLQDNLSAKFPVERGGSSSDKSKHMKVRYFYIKEKVDEGIVEIQHKRTDEVWADLLTKPVTSKKKFAPMRPKTPSPQPEDKYYYHG